MTFVRHDTLSASVEDTITATTTNTEDNVAASINIYAASVVHRRYNRFYEVEVQNVDGADEIYFTVDGTTASVLANDNHVLPAVAGSSLLVPVYAQEVEIRLISAGTPTYSVEVR